MKISLTKEDFSERQTLILNLLFEKEYQQKDLQEALKTTAPNLYYHLNKLEELDLIKKKTLYEVGNVKINEISLNPASRQQVRKIIGKEVNNYVLITGFGVLKTGYRVPDLVYNINSSRCEHGTKSKHISGRRRAKHPDGADRFSGVPWFSSRRSSGWTRS